MRAAVLIEPNAPLSIEVLKSPALGPHDVRIAVEATGVCHSDLNIAQGGMPLPLPLVLGHEGAGTVLEVGAAVRRVKVGDRVIAALSPSCGDCWFCQRDQAHLCNGITDRMTVTRALRPDGSVVHGLSGLGTFTDVMVAYEANLVRVETDLPCEQLALMSCGVATGVGAVLNTAAVKPGSSVAVIGCGGVGQSVVQGARIAGAAEIFAVDPVPLKRETALRHGATHGIDPADGDPVEQVKAATGGRGADYTFEVVGLPGTIVQAFATARRGGTIVVVGMPKVGEMVTLPAVAMFADAKSVIGSFYGSIQARRDLPLLVRLVETGRLDVGSMISKRIKLDQINEAFTAMSAGEVIRSVII
jgi:S-(hydroxymethyl)glutathione dehydrogenase / alcohol dehydrogenase